MKFLLLIAGCVVSWLPAWGASPADPIAQAVEQAVARVSPALVRIHVVSTREAEGRQVKMEASGSGVILTKEGHIITNHHVARQATRLVCVLPSNEEVEADLIGTDPLTDIAVLKLRGAPGRAWPTVAFGDSDAMRVGDTVLAMGSPLALSQSVTLGIVSNTRMIMPGGLRGQGRFTLDGEDVGSMVRWLGHDAEIQPGNSGGPLVNLQGQVIGINEIGLGSMGGAIPGNLARWVADQLIRQGRVNRSWLGIEGQPLLKQEPATQGMLVREVVKDSPAAAGGLQSGDILLKLAGQAVRVRFWEEMPLFNQSVAQLPVGQDVEVVVRRNTETKTLRLRTVDREQVLPSATELKAWGITARNLSAVLAAELRRDTRNGVLVTTVRPGGPAGEARPALTPADVITAVNDVPVTNVAALVEWTRQALASKREAVPTLVSLDRKTEKLVTVVKVGARESEDPSVELPKAWLPVAVQAITRELAEQLGDKKLTGVRVTQVYAGNTAEKAGVKVGDLIVALDATPVGVAQTGEEEVFWRQIRQYKIGTTAELEVRRGKDMVKVPVELVRAPRADREMKKYLDDDFEFSARDLTFRDKVEEEEEEKVANTSGVLITEVKPGGWASLGRLGVGDILVAVNQQPVADVDQLRATMEQVRTARPKTIVCRVRRGIHTLYLEFEPDWDNHRPATKGEAK